tara:strand:+ start:8834 stop:9760 length:927 start_codon:yes stop_codon:yes gene_type:complete
MTQPEKEKSLIELAREHMDTAGANPEQGVDIPDQPASSPERVAAMQTEPTVEPSAAQTPVASDVFDGTVQDAVGDLLSNVAIGEEWRPLELPSRGKAYVESDGFVQIKPFTFAEERKLRSIKHANQGVKVIKGLFQACVKGLNYDGMTLEDKNYILFKLREISYGDEYTVQAECPICDSKNSLTLNISNVPVKYAEDDYKEPISITLPDSKQTLVYVTPRCNDEKFLADLEVLTDNLWRFMISIGKYKDERIKREFLKSTTVKDVVYFREQLVSERYGMKNSMSYECASCGEVNESLIPFNESFFSVS